jgi:hypothetical protein
VVCLLRSWEGRFQELQVRNIATVFGRRPRDWRELWTQSVPALTEITSVDWAPEAPSLLNANGLSVKGSSAAMRSASCGRSPFSATLARCSAASGSASRPDEFARALGRNAYVPCGCPIAGVRLEMLSQSKRFAVARKARKTWSLRRRWRENE